MALNGAHGFLYLAAESTGNTTAPALTADTWYLIKGKAAAASKLPANLTTGYVFYQETTDSPVDSTAAFTSNDSVNKLTLTRLAFVTDVSVSASKEKFDETVQTDSVKSYQVSSKAEKTGTISGYWIDNDTSQQTLLKNVDEVVEQTSSGGITKSGPVTTVRKFFLSRVESTLSTGVGAEVWEYMPAIVESLQSDKPMEGPQPFSMGYTVVGSQKPVTYILDK